MKKGSTFEIFVEEQYRILGAHDVQRNVNIDGHEIDVYALVPSADGTLNRVAISCKDLERPVGVELVREWVNVIVALRSSNKIDLGVIVSSKGFTQDAHAAAAATGIKLRTADALRWAGLDLTPYLNKQSQQFASEPIFKNHLYIDLTMSFEGSNAEIRGTELIQRFLTIPDSRLLTILGDYGAGKTTFLKKLFQDMATAFLAAPGCVRLPIYLNLKDFPGQMSMQSFVLDYLVNSFGARCPNFATLIDLSNEGRVLFLLDAFDEMASRNDLKTTLTNFDQIAKFFGDQAKLIMTCRTHYFRDQGHAHTVHQGTELYQRAQRRNYKFCFLNGLKPDQIETYVRSVCGEKWNDYLTIIRETYNLAALAERPILLQMITEALPTIVAEGRQVDSTSLYAIYTDLWLRRDDWRTSLPRQDRLRFTIAFAEDMYRKEATQFSWKDVSNAISARWPSSSRQELEQYQYDIGTCSFIKRNPSDDSYSFVHESFMEYFVAVRIYEALLSEDDDILRERAHKREVIEFVVGHYYTRQVAGTIKKWLADCGNWANLFYNLCATLAAWDPRIDGVAVRRLNLPSFAVNRIDFVGCQMTGCEMRKWQIVGNRFERGEIVKCKLGGKWRNVNVVDMRITSSAFEHWELEESKLDGCHVVDNGPDRSAALTIRNSSVIRCKFSRNAASLRLDGGEFRGNEIEERGVGFAHFVNVRLGENFWTADSFDGLTFENVTFDDHGASIAKALTRGRVIRWSIAPTVVGGSGLSDEAQAAMQKAGFLFA